MKAIVQNAYGSSNVLSIKEVEKPNIKENEILIRIKATSVNAGDYFTMKGSPWLVKFTVGFPKPKDHILGWDAAGIVEAVGKNVTRFKPGDEVYGSCEHTFAEYASADVDKFALKPDNLSFEQAAAVPSAALTALNGLRDYGKIKQGDKVLINGASGGVGHFAVQIARSFGAEVTGVCSTGNVQMVRSIGADYIIDYTKEDFTQSSQHYNIIFDNVANHSFSSLRKVLTPRGTIIPNSGHGGMGYVIKAFFFSMFSKRLQSPYLVNINYEDLNYLKDLLESGKIKPVIDKTFKFDQIPEAMNYAAKGHVKGKIVIQVI